VRKRVAIGLVAATIILALVVANRHRLIHAALQSAASLASGSTVRFADQRISSTRMTLLDLHIVRHGEPLLDASRLDIEYSLRDLLPGSTRRFGLAGVAISGAILTLTHERDGSYNLPIPQGGAAPAGPQIPQRIDPVPIRFALTMHDAQIVLREPQAYDSSAKSVRIDGVNVDADVDSATITRYRAGGNFALRHQQPFTIAGTIDAVRGYAMHRMQARVFPLRALANYFADSPVVRITGGHAYDLDARLYAFDVRPNETADYHVSLTLDVRDGSLGLSALAAPLTQIRGRLQVVDNAFFVDGLHATLAQIPIEATGGIYDLTGDAQFRLGVSGHGDLTQLRHAFTFTRAQPIGGPIDLGVLIQGALDNPMIVAHATSPSVHYAALPFTGLTATVIYRDGTVALLPLDASYGGIGVAIRGALGVAGPHVLSDVAVHLATTANHLPYLQSLIGSEPIVVDAAAAGTDLDYDLHATAASTRGVDRVAALLTLRPDGTGGVEPFWLHTQRGDLDGGYALDRRDQTSAFWVLGHNLAMRPARERALPGVDLPVLPAIDGTIPDLSAAGTGAGDHVAVAGMARGRNISFAGVAFDSFAASFGGSMTDAAIDRLQASGPWGSFDGTGAFGGSTFVARGAYRGTLDGLAPFLGSAIPGHGGIAGIAGIEVEPNRIIVQGDNLHFSHATLHGVPVTHASLTLAVENDALRIYTAHASVAGGDVVAAGSFATGTHAVHAPLSLVATGLDAQGLRAIGLPLDTGHLWARGVLAAGAPLPHFDGGVSIERGSMAHFGIDGSANVDLAGRAVQLHEVVGALSGTYAYVDGTIGSLDSGIPSYGLHATVPAGNIETMLRAFDFPTYMTQGSFNANVAVGGRGDAPSVTGAIGVPAGNVNGLPFVDASATIAADPSGISAHHGRVLVGTTAVGFTGVVRPNDLVVRVHAPVADLSDFNNFFDTGDTLDGNGAVNFIAIQRGRTVATNGQIDLAGFRYRNLAFGDLRGRWSSSRNTVRGTIAIDGRQGSLSLNGSIALPPLPHVQSIVARSNYDVHAKLDRFNLAFWVPALGFQSLPVTGRASGEASISGRYPSLAIAGKAHLNGGSIGPLTLDRASIAVHAAGHRLAIDSAQLTTPGLVASASGTMGFTASDPLDLQVHAATDTLPSLLYQLTRARVPISGSFESTLRIGGTLHAPTFVAGLDATGVNAYGLGIDSMFGEVRLRGRSLEVANAGATFGKGQASLAGSLPLQLDPFAVGPPGQPLSVDLDITDLDPATFDAIAGSNTKMTGTINGHIGVSGTVAQPIILGNATLRDGSYTSDLERTPLSNAVASFVFNRTSASIQRASAKLGNGTIAGSGTIQFPDGFTSGSGVSLLVKAVAKGAQLDLPAYGSGTIDADLSLTKTPSSTAVLAGDATATNATLSFAAFVEAAQGGAKGSGPGPSLPPWPLAFDLKATAGKNVRVRGNGYGAGLDIAATGSVKLAGTLQSPTLAGTFTSAGGTLTYFDRAFRVQQGVVSFEPRDGLIPTLHAVATTNVINPDPDRARNPYGTADVTITVDGPVENLKISFASTPSGYSQEQILALIAPLGGFISGIAFNSTSALQVQSPGGITPLGQLAPLPGNPGTRTSSTITVGQEAFNLLNAQFTAGLLSPLENALGEGLGLSNVNLTLGYYGNVGVTGSRPLGKAVSAVFASTFGLPQTQSFGLRVSPSPETSATLSFFVQNGQQKLLDTPTTSVGGSGYVLGQPLLGNSGFSVTFQRYFW
jgi:hypothetical protein